MEPHVVNDVTITLEERNQIEANLNGHTLQLARIFKMGGDHGHWDRITSALVNKSGHIPVLYGLVKDHKVSAPGQPKPTRPVCGADESSNSQLSHILSVIVTAVSEIVDEDLQIVCRSTYEMKCELVRINAQECLSELVVFSTDVEAMYPSLDISEVARVAAKEFLYCRL